MPRPFRKTANPSAATLGYEAQLWQMADALRGSIDVAEYKPVSLGLIFLKYISDAFEEQHAKLVADQKSGADPENPDEYRALSTRRDLYPYLRADYVLANPPFHDSDWCRKDDDLRRQFGSLSRRSACLRSGR